MGALLDEERRRYLSLVDALALQPESAEQVRNASRKVDDLRIAAARGGRRATRSGGMA